MHPASRYGQTAQAVTSLQDVVAALSEIFMLSDSASPGVRFAKLRDRDLNRPLRQAIGKGGFYGRYEVLPSRRGVYAIRKYVGQLTAGSTFETVMDTSDTAGRPVGKGTELVIESSTADHATLKTTEGVRYTFPIAQVQLQMQQIADGAHQQAQQSQQLPDAVTPKEAGEKRAAQAKDRKPLTKSPRKPSKVENRDPNYCYHCDREHPCACDNLTDAGEVSHSDPRRGQRTAQLTAACPNGHQRSGVLLKDHGDRVDFRCRECRTTYTAAKEA